MDLMTTIAKGSVRRPHVLIVEVPGWTFTRISAERELRQRGWVQSDSPADSDILLTCGSPGAELTETIDRVWDQLPGPRVRVGASEPNQVVGVFEQSIITLLDLAGQRDDAVTRVTNGNSTSQTHDHTSDLDPMDHSSTDHGGVDHSPTHDAADHEGMDHQPDHDAMDHGGMGHGGMGHGGMEMPMPGGIGLAEGGADRDGLDLDVLHVSFGPVLPFWPAGLVVRCSLQGDIVTGASVELLSAAGSGVDREQLEGASGLTPGSARLLCAEYCDHAAGLLALLEWERLSTRVFRVRDDVVAGAPVSQVTADLERLVRRVRRSWFLRWSLKDVPEVLDRLGEFLDGARSALGGGRGAAAARVSPDDEAARIEQIPELILGLDVAAARLVIASLGLNTTAAARAGSGHA